VATTIEFEVDADSVEVGSGSGLNNVTATLSGVDIDDLIRAVDMSNLLANMDNALIVDEVGAAELLDEIGEDICINHFAIQVAEERTK